MGNEQVLVNYWLPPDIEPSQVFANTSLERPLGESGLCLEEERPTPAGMSALLHKLRSARRVRLAARSIDSIIQSLDQVAREWLDPKLPERRLCIQAIHAFTGLSEAMIGHTLDLEMRSSLREGMERALEREVGDAKALDTFVPQRSLGGFTHASGPELIGAIFSSNVPGLPHLTIMRSLLVKSACLGRTSRYEPIFLPLYVQTLARIDPELASCLAVVHWPHEDMKVGGEFYRGVDHLIAWGGDAAHEQLARRCPPELKITRHGHRIGFAVVLRSALRHQREALSLAHQLAYDFTVFEQHACLAPQALYVEQGSDVSVEFFGRAMAESMDAWADVLPPRTLTRAEQAHLRNELEMIRMRRAMGEKVRLMTPPNRLQRVVTIEPAAQLQPSPGDRFVRIMPIRSWEFLPSLLEECRGRLQNVALAGEGGEARRLRDTLARLGVSRICLPGRMGTPSMMWYHDGAPRLGELLRWTDVELETPGDAESGRRLSPRTTLP